MRALVLLSAATITSACTEQERESTRMADTTPAAAAARDSQVTWTVRPIVNAPRYFVLSDWVNDGTLWGSPARIPSTSTCALAPAARGRPAHQARGGPRIDQRSRGETRPASGS